MGEPRAKRTRRRPARKLAADGQSRRPSNRQPNRQPNRRRAPVRGALLAVLCVGLLFAFVYPTRTFLSQRDDMHRAGTQLSVLQEENAKLAAESKQLSSDAEIERLARERYGLVKPDERAFVIVPTPTTTTTTTTTPPPPSTYPGNP